VAGWLHTEINVWHRELNPDMVAHLSTNWAWHRLPVSSLIEANMLTAMPDYQPIVLCQFIMAENICFPKND